MMWYYSHVLLFVFFFMGILFVRLFCHVFFIDLSWDVSVSAYLLIGLIVWLVIYVRDKNVDQ